ncbi:ATP-binding protein [Flagellimonas sp.]|uniref:ATP-binding protein n=1 Tax=Flagellimonas sp. TaxID=2058762 RepID=UPI003BAADF15
MRDQIIKIPFDNTPIPWLVFVQTELGRDYTDIDRVVVDLHNKGFLYPFQIVIIGCLIEQLILWYNVEVIFKGGTMVLNNHLNNIKLKRYWEVDFDRDRYTKSNNGTTLCLWHISKQMIETYGMQAQSYFRRTFFNNKDLQPLASALVEVFNNVFDHSKSNVNGYVLTQYFPNLHRLQFAVCDFGIGIPTSVNDFLVSQRQVPLLDENAIVKSISRGFTSRSIPRNAGFGLANVKDFVKSSNGRMTIFSNQGYFRVKYGVEDLCQGMPINFKGTLIDVSIDTNTFEQIDPDCEVFDFF